MIKKCLIAAGLVLLGFGVSKLRARIDYTDTILIEKIVSGRDVPYYYFLLKDKNGEIIQRQVDYEDYARFNKGDTYRYSITKIYVKE